MSRAYQKVMVFGRSKPKTGKTLVLMKRTGYVDLTVNGTRFYYNNKYQYDDISKFNLSEILDNEANKNKKGIIIISRKEK